MKKNPRKVSNRFHIRLKYYKSSRVAIQLKFGSNVVATDGLHRAKEFHDLSVKWNQEGRKMTSESQLRKLQVEALPNDNFEQTQLTLSPQ